MELFDLYTYNSETGDEKLLKGGINKEDVKFYSDRWYESDDWERHLTVVTKSADVEGHTVCLRDTENLCPADRDEMVA